MKDVIFASYNLGNGGSDVVIIKFDFDGNILKIDDWRSIYIISCSTWNK